MGQRKCPCDQYFSWGCYNHQNRVRFLSSLGYSTLSSEYSLTELLVFGFHRAAFPTVFVICKFTSKIASEAS